jgi:hypothetical protein
VRAIARITLLVALAAVLVPSAVRSWPARSAIGKAPLNEVELAALITRDFSHWLAKHAGTKAPVVLAPPNETAGIAYYGGLAGIGTLSWENTGGVAAASRIFTASTPQEAFARVQTRQVTHIVVPSWDRFLNEYVRMNGAQVENTFLAGLRNWAPVPWLKPIAYELPEVPGYEGQSIAVFEVVEEQSEPTIIGWQAEYFAEMGKLDYASALSQSLRRYSGDFGAWISRAQVAIATHDRATLTEAMTFFSARLKAGADRRLSWERRTGLAIALAQGDQPELAREQVKRCFAEADGNHLRKASTQSLFKLLSLGHSFGLELPDARLRALSRDLLPADWRSRL